MLYTPIKIKGLELKNRWVMSPMCMYSCEDGVANDFHLVHYGSRAQGGVGLIVVEATGVNPAGRITNKCMGLWNDEQRDALKTIVDFVHNTTDTKMGIQLAHAGRKASTWEGVQISLEEGWETVAPSPIPYMDGERIPHELTVEEIIDLVQDFKNATVRAVEAGFDVIEIHAAHGYLLHEFLSPLSNTRQDEYGGSLENRSRFLMEVVDAIQDVLKGEKPLFVRISATEYAENGWDIEESVQLSKMLKEAGVDVVDVSTGGNIHGARISLFDGYQVPFAERVRKEAGIAVGAVGLIKSGAQAEDILNNEQADFIFLGRELLRNPYLPTMYAMETKQNCYFPEQYERGKI